jgi:predicted ribosome quality control (RQC) complex YloA/Tae2 family protein
MKYFLLEQWIAENKNKKLAIEQVLHNAPLLAIRFRTGASLMFYYKTATPLLFFTSEQDSSASAAPVWQQLNNAELTGMEIADNDRIITFHFVLKDIYQTMQRFSLLFECMPPRGNVILCLEEKQKLLIQDALIKYTYADNPGRQILPSLSYEPPHTAFQPVRQEVILPLLLKPPLTEKEIICPTVNDYFRTVYQEVILKKAATQRKATLVAKWKSELKKAEKKLAVQQAELAEAEQMSTWLTYSEIIKVNLQNIKKGDSVLNTINYFDPELHNIIIPLQADKNPQENLKQYLKKYRKARQGKEKITLQKEKTSQQIEQINHVLQQLESDQWQNLDIEADHPEASLAKIKQADSLLKLAVNQDWDILIGRKATENDLVTTQIGRPQDWWFHTRIYRGAHVLLRNYHKKEPPGSLVELCCGLAAWYSKARNSENVPVDYTQIRFIRKPRKSAPGFVTYTNHKTMFVDPIDVSAAREILSKYGE